MEMVTNRCLRSIYCRKEDNGEREYFSAFKNELGYVNATNQYVELSIRITEKDHSLDIKNDLQGLAQSVNLNVSTLSED